MLSAKSRIRASLSSVPSSSGIPAPVLKNRQKNVPQLPDIDTAQMKTATNAFTEKQIADLIDLQLKRSTCGIDFIFAVSQQANFTEKEFESVPSKCEKYNGQRCNQFADTGSRSFGSNCKFLHAATEDNRQSDKPTFDIADKLPGLINTPLTFHGAGRCLRGDDCAFRHKGKEFQQEERVVAAEKELKSETLMVISKIEMASTEENQSDVPRSGQRELRPPIWTE